MGRVVYAQVGGRDSGSDPGAVAPLLETIDDLNEQIHYYDQMEEQIACAQYPKYSLLEQVNGVGVHTAPRYRHTLAPPVGRPWALNWKVKPQVN